MTPPPPGQEAPGGFISDATTLLADLASRWAQASSVDEPSTPDESAILSWHPRTRARYGSRLCALAAYAARTSPPTVAEALAGILPERAHMGATASSIRSFMSAIRAVENLLWIPPARTALHKRIAAGAASAGLQPYLPPAGLVILVENASKSRYEPLLGALTTLAWACFLRVGEIATVRVADIALPESIQFWNSKTGEEGYTTRPLSRYADQVR